MKQSGLSLITIIGIGRQSLSRNSYDTGVLPFRFGISALRSVGQIPFRSEFVFPAFQGFPTVSFEVDSCVRVHEFRIRARVRVRYQLFVN